MDTRRRTWAKAICWQVIGLIASLGVGYAFTGSVRIGGAMALVNASIGFVVYLVYERVWANVGWGRVSYSPGANNHE